MSEKSPPMTFTWDGEHMVPAAHLAKVCAQTYTEGQTYVLAEHQGRSSVTHRHYFACLARAWENLPEELIERFPTSEHLRKFCLVRAGYATHRELVAETANGALQMAVFARETDPYAVITVKGSVVTIYTAKSQDERSMNKREFQASKEAVFDQLAKILGVSPDQLENAQEAA